MNKPNVIPVGNNYAGGRLQTHKLTHTNGSLETMKAAPRRGNTGVVPTIRMLSGLPDVVLTHVHRKPSGRGGACSTACDTGSAGSECRGDEGEGDTINVIETEGGDLERGEYRYFFFPFSLKTIF